MEFKHGGYSEFTYPPNSIIYCDPPYANTTNYKGNNKFSHELFWEWVRDMTKVGHQVFISEYTAPEDFTCVYEKEVTSGLGAIAGSEVTKKATEKLFIYSP